MLKKWFLKQFDKIALKLGYAKRLTPETFIPHISIESAKYEVDRLWSKAVYTPRMIAHDKPNKEIFFRDLAYALYKQLEPYMILETYTDSNSMNQVHTLSLLVARRKTNA